MRTSWWVDWAKEMGMMRMSGASASVAEHSSADRQCLWRQSMHTPRRSVPYLQAALPRLAASRCFRVALALPTVCRVASICEASRALLAQASSGQRYLRGALPGEGENLQIW